VDFVSKWFCVCVCQCILCVSDMFKLQPTLSILSTCTCSMAGTGHMLLTEVIRKTQDILSGHVSSARVLKLVVGNTTENICGTRNCWDHLE